MYKIENIINKVHCADCLELMRDIPDKTIDMILCDLPFQITACHWDTIIPFEPLWEAYKRIIKDNGAIVLTASQPFTSKLVMSNIDNFKYTLVWEKTTPTGHLNANKMPMRVHEDILIFYKKQPPYKPQKTTGHKRKVSSAFHKRNSIKTENYGNHKLTSYDSTERYPVSILKFATDKQKYAFHPTQKPVALGRYLIKTYTNKGDLILDNCCGSGSFLVSAKLENRNFIGIEKEEKYCKIAEERLKQEVIDF